jgi:metal-sulfur cluster biosynthetic enzyme
VLDPELDEPLVKLGFIDRVEVQGADVTILFKLPTYWCSPNFAYLMAADLRDSARTVPGVRHVRVALLDHCAEDEVTNGINEGKTFAEAFPEEEMEDEQLDALRRTFLRKGFLVRQDTLLRAMMKAGLDETTISALQMRNLVVDEAANTAYITVHDKTLQLDGVGKSGRAYAQRRATLGLPGATEDALIIDDQGQPLQAGKLKEFLRRSRSIRMNILFNTSLCKGLFRTRYGGDTTPEDDDEFI